MTTSLKLSKRLFELKPEWNDTDYWYGDMHNTPDDKNMIYANTVSCPAYSLGYLIRKLPLVRLQHVALDSDDLDRWCCSMKSVSIAKYGETPEDAAASLCIALIEEGLL